MKFGVVWEDCIQEETRVANREALLKEDDQALATHTKKRRSQSNFKGEISRSLNLPEESKEQGKILQIKTTLAFNVFIVIRQDTLPEIVL